MSKIELLHFPTKLVFYISVHGNHLFFHAPHSFHQPIISTLPAKCIQNPTICHRPHCYHSGLSHHHLKPVFSQSPFNQSPYFHLCPSPIIYSKLGNQSNIFKHKSCPVTLQLKTLRCLSLPLRIKSLLWPRSPYLTWGSTPLLLHFLIFFPQFTLCHTLQPLCCSWATAVPSP